GRIRPYLGHNRQGTHKRIRDIDDEDPDYWPIDGGDTSKNRPYDYLKR
ncbi:unnamed protein product, partial [marine sediment metagenome]